MAPVNPETYVVSASSSPTVTSPGKAIQFHPGRTSTEVNGVPRNVSCVDTCKYMACARGGAQDEIGPVHVPYTWSKKATPA